MGREYELTNGARITRKPGGVLIEPNGATLRNIAGTRRSFFSSRGFNLQDVKLSMEMEELQFRNEVSKLGIIKSNPSNPHAQRLRGRPARPVSPGRAVKSARPVKSASSVKSTRSIKPTRAANKKPAGVVRPARSVRPARLPVRSARSVSPARAVSKRPGRAARKEPAHNVNKRQVRSKKRNARAVRKRYVSRSLRRKSARR